MSLTKELLPGYIIWFMCLIDIIEETRENFFHDRPPQITLLRSCEEVLIPFHVQGNFLEKILSNIFAGLVLPEKVFAVTKVKGKR